MKKVIGIVIGLVLIGVGYYFLSPGIKEKMEDRKTEKEVAKVYKSTPKVSPWDKVKKAPIKTISIKDQSGKEFFHKITPSFSFGADPINDFSVSFSWKEAHKTKSEIINLPETIARKRGIKIVVCIDEFQNIVKLNRNGPSRKPIFLHRPFRLICRKSLPVRKHQEPVVERPLGGLDRLVQWPKSYTVAALG